MGCGNRRFVAALGVAAALVAPTGEAAAQPSAERMIERMDSDGDGRISKDEFRGRRRPFSDFDRDGDGYATREEIEAVLGAGVKRRSRPGRSTEGAGPGGQRGGSRGMAAGAGGLSGRATMDDLDTVTRNAFLLQRVRADEIARGLIESTLIPVYPGNASCPHIDHIFGEPWQGPVHERRGNATRHHGADIPATHGTPILAMADGTVIAKSTGEGSFRGIEVVIRHAPEDTGLPVWLYTMYAHFATMPAVRIGQRVRMGDPLGPTGKTGVPSDRREDHLHLGILYNTSGRYVVTKHGVVPVDGYYADVVTLMRRRMPLDTNAMRALPEGERRVAIPHRMKSGATVPAGTKIIWPYACEAD